MKRSNNRLAILSLATATPFLASNMVVQAEIMPFYYGQFKTCPQGSFIQQFQNDLGQTLYIDCVPYPGVQLTTSTADSSVVDAEGDNNWQCVTQGSQNSCPPGQSLTGLCISGSAVGSTEACEEFCDPDTPGEDWEMAYLCTPTPTTNEGINLGTWGEALNPDQSSETGCADGQVMCGICYDFDGGGESCGGKQGQYKCCDPSPTTVTGYWQWIWEIQVNTTEERCVGTDKTQADTQTTTWNDQVTATVEAGLEVAGLGSAKTTLSTQQSQGYSSMSSSTWGTTTQDCTTQDFDEIGMNVWQWNFDIQDNFGNSVTSLSENLALTPSQGQPPQCQPGYNIDTNYQTCESDRYLPGFPGYEPSRRRDLLRGMDK